MGATLSCVGGQATAEVSASVRQLQLRSARWQPAGVCGSMPGLAVLSRQLVCRHAGRPSDDGMCLLDVALRDNTWLPAACGLFGL